MEISTGKKYVMLGKIGKSPPPQKKYSSDATDDYNKLYTSHFNF